ncbi:mammalian cell entry protein [Mycolicibacterium stellerae]|uniref:mammalian cell entry protein n=1 Tax=Mycolicibacterium stellerae TaxID=2358193 RepID=UPI000F0B720A|nr:mammalian cell entry protein [Mycolicibacterium stellerae]
MAVDESTPVRVAAPSLRFVFLLMLVALAALVAVGGWLGYQAYGSLQIERQHGRFLDAGKEAAVKLTTISYTDADADVERILDSATGQFADDFRTRSQPFINMVKQVQSTTVGTVAQAGLESVDGDKARILVAVSVKATLGTGGEQPTHVWRMRIDVEKVGNQTKVSNVEFVA